MLFCISGAPTGSGTYRTGKAEWNKQEYQGYYYKTTQRPAYATPTQVRPQYGENNQAGIQEGKVPEREGKRMFMIAIAVDYDDY